MLDRDELLNLDIDEYRVVHNTPANFNRIARILWHTGHFFCAWTDGDATQYDILFVINPVTIGPVQGGIRANDLFISIMRVGAFAFEIKEDPQTHPGYYIEKLFRVTNGSWNQSSTDQMLADLFNGVRHELWRVYG